jgi:hypothetical protein
MQTPATAPVRFTAWPVPEIVLSHNIVVDEPLDVIIDKISHHLENKHKCGWTLNPVKCHFRCCVVRDFKVCKFEITVYQEKNNRLLVEINQLFGDRELFTELYIQFHRLFSDASPVARRMTVPYDEHLTYTETFVLECLDQIRQTGNHNYYHVMGLLFDVAKNYPQHHLLLLERGFVSLLWFHIRQFSTQLAETIEPWFPQFCVEALSCMMETGNCNAILTSLAVSNEEWVLPLVEIIDGSMFPPDQLYQYYTMRLEAARLLNNTTKHALDIVVDGLSGDGGVELLTRLKHLPLYISLLVNDIIDRLATRTAFS